MSHFQNAAQVIWMNFEYINKMLRERNTLRKARIAYKRPKNVSSIVRIILFHDEELLLTWMEIFFFDSQSLHVCLCCVSRRLQGSLKGPRLRFLKPPWSTLRKIFSAIYHVLISQSTSVYHKTINMRYKLKHGLIATTENSYICFNWHCRPLLFFF